MADTVYLQGPVMYAQVFESNRDMEGFEGAFKEFNGAYKIRIGLDEDDAAVVMKWNKRYEPKQFGDKGYTEDNNAVEGVEYFLFKRKHEHRKKNGDLIPEWSGPPEIVDAEGNEWDTSTPIGNGSTCTLKLNVQKPAGSRITYVRLEKIRVDELVEYEGGDGDREPDEEVEKPKSSADAIPF